MIQLLTGFYTKRRPVSVILEHPGATHRMGGEAKERRRQASVPVSISLKRDLPETRSTRAFELQAVVARGSSSC
jgi:hypothetical protein